MAVSRGIVKDKTRGAGRHRHRPTQNGQKCSRRRGQRLLACLLMLPFSRGDSLGRLLDRRGVLQVLKVASCSSSCNQICYAALVSCCRAGPALELHLAGLL